MSAFQPNRRKARLAKSAAKAWVHAYLDDGRVAKAVAKRAHHAGASARPLAQLVGEELAERVRRKYEHLVALARAHAESR